MHESTREFPFSEKENCGVESLVEFKAKILMHGNSGEP